MKPAAECLIALMKLTATLEVMDKKARERLIVHEVSGLGPLGREEVQRQIHLVLETLLAVEPGVAAAIAKNNPNIRLHDGGSA